MDLKDKIQELKVVEAATQEINEMQTRIREAKEKLEEQINSGMAEGQYRLVKEAEIRRMEEERQAKMTEQAARIATIKTELQETLKSELDRFGDEGQVKAAVNLARDHEVAIRQNKAEIERIQKEREAKAEEVKQMLIQDPKADVTGLIGEMQTMFSEITKRTELIASQEASLAKFQAKTKVISENMPEYESIYLLSRGIEIDNWNISKAIETMEDMQAKYGEPEQQEQQEQSEQETGENDLPVMEQYDASKKAYEQANAEYEQTKKEFFAVEEQIQAGNASDELIAKRTELLGKMTVAQGIMVKSEAKMKEIKDSMDPETRRLFEEAERTDSGTSPEGHDGEQQDGEHPEGHDGEQQDEEHPEGHDGEQQDEEHPEGHDEEKPPAPELTEEQLAEARGQYKDLVRKYYDLSEELAPQLKPLEDEMANLSIFDEEDQNKRNEIMSKIVELRRPLNAIKEEMGKTPLSADQCKEVIDEVKQEVENERKARENGDREEGEDEEKGASTLEEAARKNPVAYYKQLGAMDRLKLKQQAYALEHNGKKPGKIRSLFLFLRSPKYARAAQNHLKDGLMKALPPKEERQALESGEESKVYTNEQLQEMFKGLPADQVEAILNDPYKASEAKLAMLQALQGEAQQGGQGENPFAVSDDVKRRVVEVGHKAGENRETTPPATPAEHTVDEGPVIGGDKY